MKDLSDRKIAEKIFQFSSLDGKRVLEIGCGDGRITGFLAGRPRELIAIEPDPESIQEARRTISGVDFRIGSGEHLEFLNEAFDMVLFTLSLHHHEDSTTALREAARVLKAGGEILVIEPTIEGEVERIFALVSSEDQAVLNARESIRRSDLMVKDSEIFYATWVFDHKEELVQYIFDYFEAPFDLRLSEKMIDLLGTRSEDRPIELQDELLIQSLKKK